LESTGKPAFSIGRIPPTPGLVDQYFNGEIAASLTPLVHGTMAATGKR
jgi:hypothetical protein